MTGEEVKQMGFIDWSLMWLSLTSCIAIGYTIVAGFIDGPLIFKTGVRRMKSKFKAIVIAWCTNLVLFTTLLWLGTYMKINGHEWIDLPLGTTLFTLGATKIALTVMLAFMIFGRKEIE